jgi:hypothetical protein
MMLSMLAGKKPAHLPLPAAAEFSAGGNEINGEGHFRPLRLIPTVEIIL